MKRYKRIKTCAAMKTNMDLCYIFKSKPQMPMFPDHALLPFLYG